MMTPTHVNYQSQGQSPTLSDANKNINISRDNTPAELRHLYHSSIRYQAGKYQWYWVLRN